MQDQQRHFHPAAFERRQLRQHPRLIVVEDEVIVFGTDFPWRTAAETVQGFKQNRVFSEGEQQAIDAANALALLPRLAKV